MSNFMNSGGDSGTELGPAVGLGLDTALPAYSTGATVDGTGVSIRRWRAYSTSVMGRGRGLDTALARLLDQRGR